MVWDGRALSQDGHVPSSGAFAFHELFLVLVFDFDCFHLGNAIAIPITFVKGWRSIISYLTIVKCEIGTIRVWREFSPTVNRTNSTPDFRKQACKLFLKPAESLVNILVRVLPDYF